MTVKHFLSASAIGFLTLASTAFAADATDASDHTATANVNLVTQYRFRGFDLSTSSGLYAGVWASNVSANSYPGGSLELDYYGGYNGKINDDLNLSVANGENRSLNRNALVLQAGRTF